MLREKNSSSVGPIKKEDSLYKVAIQRRQHITIWASCSLLSTHGEGMYRSQMRAFAYSTLACLAVHCSAASAGWYQITNYEGTIGTAPVHISLQGYAKLNQGDARLTGSYYYNKHRIPLKLDGLRSTSGEITLCESTVKAGDPVDKTSKPRCTFTLHPSPEGLKGSWKDGATALEVRLNQVGLLDNNDQERLEGKLEIPMWYHTSKAMFVGVYRKVKECDRIVMTELRVVSVAHGRTLANLLEGKERLAPDEELAVCQSGILMTNIYQNLESGNSARSVTIHYGGGKMGYDDLQLLNRAAY
jgi:hypothetical protein